MARLEKIEEEKFTRYVKGRGWKAIKLTTAGYYGETGYNDRLVLAPWRIAALFEFKRVGEVPSKIQGVRHRQIKAMGFPVYVVFSSKEAIKILLGLVHTKVISKGVHKVRAHKTGRRIPTGTGAR